MQDTATTSTQIAERAAKPRRGGPSRLQTVGDYAGQLAGEAAQAVRRAGLKPGLERSFGFAAELRGQIVAQEPEVGSELGRNGLVTLYVAAPGAQPCERAVVEPSASEQADVEVSARGVARTEPASDRADAAPRRRKSRRSPGAGRPAFDAPPPPRLPSFDQTPGVHSRDEPDDDEVESDRATEEYVIDPDELFGGRTSAVAWRRVYARRHLGCRVRLAGRPRLAIAALALLAVWLVVALAAELIENPASPQPPHVGQEHARARARTPPLTNASARPSWRRAVPPQRHAARRRPAPKRRRAPLAPVPRPVERATHVEPAPVAPRSTVVAPASHEFGPERQKAEGGPFSP